MNLGQSLLSKTMNLPHRGLKSARITGLYSNSGFTSTFFGMGGNFSGRGLPKAGARDRSAGPKLAEVLKVQDRLPHKFQKRIASIFTFWRSLPVLFQLRISSLHPIEDHVGDQSQCSFSYEKPTIARSSFASSWCPSFLDTASNCPSFTTNTCF